MFGDRGNSEVTWQTSNDRNGWVEVKLGRLCEPRQSEEYERGPH